MDTEDEIRRFLTDNAGHKGFIPTTNEMVDITKHYNETKFVSPAGDGKPPVVKIPRIENGIPKVIYAVLWKATLNPNNEAGWGYLGVEISDHSGSSPVDAAEVNRSGTFAADDDLTQYVLVKGILDVRLPDGAAHQFQVRLSDNGFNKENEAFPRQYKSPLK